MSPTFYPALFLFLAAGAVSLAAFGSVTSWIIARSREREAHERLRLLRALAERPVESARLAVDELRDHERRADERRLKEQGMAGIIAMAVGVGLAVMLLATAGLRSGAWAVGMIPFLAGLALVFTARI